MGVTWQVLATGFVLGWSVAWPPGPINAEIARRCLASGVTSGLGVLTGACAGDALWAVLVSMGVATVLTTPAVHLALGVLSTGLLVALGAVFLRGAWSALQPSTPPSGATARPSQPATARGGFALGVTMALTSPWNVAFWLGVLGRPGQAATETATALAMAAAVLAGAFTWGVLWSGAVTLLRRGGGGRWWQAGANAATGALMLWFAASSALRLAAWV